MQIRYDIQFSIYIFANHRAFFSKNESKKKIPAKMLFIIAQKEKKNERRILFCD